jgi:hypothetical protein
MENEEIRELDGRLHLSSGAIEKMRLKEFSSKEESISLKVYQHSRELTHAHMLFHRIPLLDGMYQQHALLFHHFPFDRMWMKLLVMG